MGSNYERNEEYYRAQYALQCIRRIANDAAISKKYGTYVKSAGTLLQSAGLLQVLTYYLSKASEKDRYFSYLIVDLLYYALMDEKNPCGTRETLEETSLNLYQQFLKKAEDPAELMLITSRTRSIVRWLQRFAKSLIKSDEDVNKTETPAGFEERVENADG